MQRLIDTIDGKPVKPVAREPGAWSPEPREALARALRQVADLVCLAKPRITVMVILTGLGGMLLARRTGVVASLDWSAALWALGSLAMVVSGANALNMFLERDTDALMARTRSRPLPARRMSPGTALVFGLLLSGVSLPLLALRVNLLTAALAGLALVIYVLAYTPLKRVTSRALVIGAVPGAMPPLIGWTAATGDIGWPGIALFAVLFFWQIPHFIAIATFRRVEYTAAGIRVLPVERGDRVARLHATLHAVALLGASAALVPLGVGGPVYVAAALVLGACFVAVSGVGLTARALAPAGSERWARALFGVSLTYLPLLIAAMMVGI